jgi:electron transfer flavoprotein alpha subunit
MAEVLVLVDHVDGTPKKVSYELLTLARELGTPSAVVLGKGASAAAEKVGAYGAEKVYVSEAEELDGFLAGPKAAVLAQLVARRARPRCCSRATARARRSRAAWPSRPAAA